MLIGDACDFSPASFSRPDLFMPLVEFKARTDAVIDRYKNSSKAQGFNEILMSGELKERVIHHAYGSEDLRKMPHA